MYQNCSLFLVRMTGLVARETSVIAIVAQYAPIVSAAQVQVANIVCRQLKNCRKSVAVTKKRRTKSSFVACVRQNLVFRAIFESVLDDKYFFAIVMKSVVDDKHWLL